MDIFKMLSIDYRKAQSEEARKDYIKASRSYLRAGDREKAGEMYEKEGDYFQENLDYKISCYEQAIQYCKNQDNITRIQQKLSQAIELKGTRVSKSPQKVASVEPTPKTTQPVQKLPEEVKEVVPKKEDKTEPVSADKGVVEEKVIDEEPAKIKSISESAKMEEKDEKPVKEKVDESKQIKEVETSKKAESEKLCHLAEVFYDNQKLDEAIVSLNKAINLDPDNSYAKQLLTEIESTKDKAIKLYTQGKEYLSKGDKESAVKLLKESLELYPSCGEATELLMNIQASQIIERPVKLTYEDEQGNKTRYLLRDQDSMNIGRSRENDIIFSNKNISRHHVKLEYNKNQFTITDMGSKNGTSVNEKKIDKPTPLEDGMILDIGGVVKLRFGFIGGIEDTQGKEINFATLKVIEKAKDE